MGKPLEFWFELASTYSYPAAEQVRRIIACGAAEIRLRPFLLGPIFKQQGWETTPFNLYPAKGEYMWRDVARRCAQLELPFQKPQEFPQSTLMAARLCTALQHEPQLPNIVCALYRQNFSEGGNLADETCLQAVLEAHQLEPTTWLAEARSAETKQALRTTSEDAHRAGIFGAPSFTVCGELFWGEDRLQQALSLASVPCALPDIELSPFQHSDRSSVVSLWQNAGLVTPHDDPNRDIDIRCREQAQLFLLARKDDTVVGTCMAGFDGQRGWLHYVAVAPPHRRRGIGSALIAGAEARLRTLGCTKVNLQIRNDNEAVVPFYEELGFCQEARLSLGKRLTRAD